jgi:HlyD family secretion protein
VLTVLAEPGEAVATGSPLYTLADLSSLKLRAYASGNQFAQLRLGMPVAVLVDDGAGGIREVRGEVSSIASQAQFTPTPIQTRDARAELVYGFDVRVPNADGLLKIGMPGEVRFLNTPAERGGRNSE